MPISPSCVANVRRKSCVLSDAAMPAATNFLRARVTARVPARASISSPPLGLGNTHATDRAGRPVGLGPHGRDRPHRVVDIELRPRRAHRLAETPPGAILVR